MTNPKTRTASAIAVAGAVLALFVVVPSVISLANGDGAICFETSTCPLSSLNPCVRKPSFALVGRCAVAIK